jgi:hypothetical protein
VLAGFPGPKTNNRHLDRSCSQPHCEHRSGEVRFSTRTLTHCPLAVASSWPQRKGRNPPGATALYGGKLRCLTLGIQSSATHRDDNGTDGTEASIICDDPLRCNHVALGELFGTLHGHRFHRAINLIGLIDVILVAGGIVALWLMRPIAAAFYAAAQIVTSVITAVINTFFLKILQEERASVATSSLPVWATWALPIMGIALVLGIRISLFLYVWRVTSLLPKLSEAGPKFP